jgi:hypothetical protein
MSKSLFTYIEQQKAKDEGAYLGILTWYTVVETLVPHAKFVQALKDNGLKDYVPRSARKADIFNRTAFNGQHLKLSTPSAEVHVNYLIRPVSKTAEKIVKHIVIETVNSAGERLDYEEVHSLVFDVKTETLADTCLINTEDVAAKDLAQRLYKDFLSAQGCVDDHGIRSVIRRVLDAAGSTAVRPTGGIYFVAASGAKLIDQLTEAIKASVPAASLHSLPLVDDETQREMLANAYESEMKEQVDALMAELSVLLKEGSKIHGRKIGRILREVGEIKKKNVEYRDLLTGKLDATSIKISLLAQQVQTALKRQDEDGDE